MRPRLSTASTTSGSGLFQLRDRVQADHRAPADRGHRLALGEDLGVRADADLEILAPQPLGLQRRLGRGRRRAARHDVAQEAPISPAMRARIASAVAGSPAARSSITRSSIERAKVTPQALSACRSQGASSRGPRRRALGDRRAGRARGPAAAASQPTGSSSSSRSRTVGASRGGDVEDVAVAQGRRRRARRRPRPRAGRPRCRRRPRGAAAGRRARCRRSLAVPPLPLAPAARAAR